MNRRKFLVAAATGATTVIIYKPTNAGKKMPFRLELPEGLSKLEQEMYIDVHEQGYTTIPSRKALEHRPKHFDQLKALKSLCSKDLIKWDVSFESKCYVFFPKN